MLARPKLWVIMNVFFLLVSQGISFKAFAEDHDKNQALSISAAKAEIDEPSGWAVYSGSVVLEQGSLSIECDQLQIFRSESGIDKIIASGTPARYSQNIEASTQNESLKNEEQKEPQTIQATAKQITYQLESRSIELEGGAQIQQGDNIFEGYSILYQIDNRKIIARSDDQKTEGEKPQRVKIILPIKNKQKKPPKTSESEE